MLSRAEARGAFRRAGGGRDPRGGHRSGAHRGGQPDDVGGGGSKVAGPGSGGAGVSDHDDDPAHVQHRQRAGLWVHGIHTMKVRRGKFRQVSWVVYVLTAIFIFRFIDLSDGA